MTLASARVQSFLNVQIVVWMAKQSVRMITPVVNSLIKIIIKVKTKIDTMAVVLWRMLTAAIYTCQTKGECVRWKQIWGQSGKQALAAYGSVLSLTQNKVWDISFHVKGLAWLKVNFFKPRPRSVLNENYDDITERCGQQAVCYIRTLFTDRPCSLQASYSL